MNLPQKLPTEDLDHTFVRERHYPISYWAGVWGFSTKTVREWFEDEHGLGILRQANTGRRSKRDYVSLRIAPSAAARIYAKRTGQHPPTEVN